MEGLQSDEEYGDEVKCGWGDMKYRRLKYGVIR